MERTKILITGPLKGNVERLKGLVEVSNPKLVIVLGPLGLKEPLRLNRKWFFVRGASDEPEAIAKSDGIDFSSRIFMTGTGISFSGLSGVYHPSTEKLTRRDWLRARGKLDRKSRNYLFREDYEGIIVPFRNSPLKRLDFLVLADSPEKPPIKRIIEETKPKYVFYPAQSYKKERVGETTFIALEEITSPKGKYLLHL